MKKVILINDKILCFNRFYRIIYEKYNKLYEINNINIINILYYKYI